MGLLGVIGVVLVILKLAGLIALGWVWVLMPFWLIPIIWVVVLIVGVAFVKSLDSHTHRRKRRW